MAIIALDVNGKVAAVHQSTFGSQKKLQKYLKADSLFRLEVPRRVFYYGDSFALVPGMLFDTNLMPVYLFFADQPSEQSTVFQTSLESNTLHLVASIDSEIADILYTESAETVFHHGASCFLSYLLKEKFNLIDQEILLQLFDDCFFLAAFSKQDLVLFNRFEVHNKEEILSYLMGVLQQLSFNRNHCRVTIFGAFEGLGIDAAWGETYFKNFRISTPHANLQYLEGAEEFQHPSVFESYWIMA